MAKAWSVLFLILIVQSICVGAQSLSQDNSLLECNGVLYRCTTNQAVANPGEVAAGACQNICGYYCSVNGVWVPDGVGDQLATNELGEGEHINTLKHDLIDGYQCCPEMWCYNGYSCIPNQKFNPSDTYIYYALDKRWRCIDGSWWEAKPVTTWDNHFTGFCPRAEDCLVSLDGNPNMNYNPEAYFSAEKPQCIATGQHILDYYCNNGEWYSRTALVAGKMLELVAGYLNNFSLICDAPSEVLNNYGYRVDNKAAIAYLGNNCLVNQHRIPCVNNFCVLRFGNEQMFGVSLNQPLFADAYSFSDLVGLSSCPGNPQDGYIACTPNTLYNPNDRVLIYTRPGLGLGGSRGVSGWDMFLYLIRNPIDSLLQIIREGRVSFRSRVGLRKGFATLVPPRFSKLYLATEGGSTIRAVAQFNIYNRVLHRYESYMTVNYNNLDFDICEPINQYSGEFVNCNATSPGNYIVIDRQPAPVNLVAFWKELTVKLELE